MLSLFYDIFSPPRHMLLLVAALWVGLTLAEKHASHHNISKDDLNNLTFYGLIAFMLGGRISFVLDNLSAFAKSPVGIFSINPDLFDPAGGYAAAIIAALIYGQRRNLQLWPTLDALTPFLATLFVGIGFSHLAAGTAFGKETTLPIGIELWNAIRHPVQIYEIIAAFLTLGWVWFGKQNQQTGMIFLHFTALTAVSQIILHAFRADSPAMLGGINQAQIIAWLVLAVSFFFMEKRLQNNIAVA